MNCHHLNLIILIWELVNFSGIVSEKTCALNKLFVCPDGESCKQVKNSSLLGICGCKNKFIRITPDGACVEQVDSNNPTVPSPASNYSQGASVSAIAGGLLTALLLILLSVGLVYAAKKYRWVHRVREKAQQYRAQNYDTVLVSQEDDPPLA